MHAPMGIGTAATLSQPRGGASRFHHYVDISRAVMEVLTRFTPLVEPISIDEAFLDVRGATPLRGNRERSPGTSGTAVRRELDLPISVGGATTKHLAKIASRVAKPDGMLLVAPGTEKAFLRPLPVGFLWGVGPVGEERLARYGMRTIGDLAEVSADTLAAWMGEHWGRRLWHLANNLDARTVEGVAAAGSVGAQSAGEATGVAERHTTLLALADRIGTRLRRKENAGRRITVRVRFADMTAVTRSLVLPAAIAETTSLYRAAAALTDALILDRSGGRRGNLLGISVDRFEEAPHLQLELPLGPGAGQEDPALRAGSETHRRLRSLDAAVDVARSKFGRGAVQRAAVLGREPEERSPTAAAEEPRPQGGPPARQTMTTGHRAAWRAPGVAGDRWETLQPVPDSAVLDRTWIMGARSSRVCRHDDRIEHGSVHVVSLDGHRADGTHDREEVERLCGSDPRCARRTGAQVVQRFPAAATDDRPTTLAAKALVVVVVAVEHQGWLGSARRPSARRRGANSRASCTTATDDETPQARAVRRDRRRWSRATPVGRANSLDSSRAARA